MKRFITKGSGHASGKFNNIAEAEANDENLTMEKPECCADERRTMFLKSEKIRKSAWRGAAALLLALSVLQGSWANTPAQCVLGAVGPHLRAQNPRPLALRLPRIPGATDWGPRARIEALAETRDPSQILELILGQYNVLNLQELQGKVIRVPTTGAFLRNPETGELLKDLPPLSKPLDQVVGVAATIRRANPDIIVMEEVESFGAVSLFNEQYLSNAYQVVLIDGNDARNIDIAFLVKKDLPFNVDIQSFKNVARKDSENPLFSRDLPVAVFREKGANPESKPAFVVMGTHYKSQRGSEADALGEVLRREQVEATVEIIRFYEHQFGREVPIFLVGDFNRDIRAGPEFTGLWQKLGMKDSFELAPAGKTVAREQRVTHTFHPEGGAPTQNNQLDSISASPIVGERKIVTQAEVMPYLDPAGRPKKPPRSFKERKKNPSDHMMIRTILDYQKIRALTKP